MGKLDWLTARPIAHRGFHDASAGRIENTLPAVTAAIERGFAIEVDLQMTSDGVIVVFHDDTVDRLMAGSGRVDSMSYAALRALSFRDADSFVPTLAELLVAVGGRVPLVVELKSDFKGDRRLEHAAAPLLAAYRGPLVVMSFDPESMQTMKRLAPAIPRGIVADRYTNLDDWGFLPAWKRFSLRHLLSVPSVAPSFISYDLKGLPFPAPSLLHRLGMTLICWTVRSKAGQERAKRYTDQITFEGFDPDR